MSRQSLALPPGVLTAVYDLFRLTLVGGILTPTLNSAPKQKLARLVASSVRINLMALPGALVIPL